MTGSVLAALWELAAVAFLVLVILGVRKAKARSQRLFVDLPAKRLGSPPKHPPVVDHRWDALP